MRRRVLTPKPKHSIAESVEYGITILLVVVVAIAVLEIFRVNFGLRY